MDGGSRLPSSPQVLIAAIKDPPPAPSPVYLFIYVFISYTPTPQQHANPLRFPPPPPPCLTNKTEITRLKPEFVCLGSRGSDDRSESTGWLALNFPPRIGHFLAAMSFFKIFFLSFSGFSEPQKTSRGGFAVGSCRFYCNV